MMNKTFKQILVFSITILFLINIPLSEASMSASNSSDECFGFIIPVNQYQSNNLQINISILINELLGSNIEVFWITNMINVSSKTLDEDSPVENNIFEKGSYIIPFSDDQTVSLMTTNIIFNYYAKDIVASYKLMESIENIEVYQLVEPKIAVHNGPSVDAYNFANCLRKGGFHNIDFLTYSEIPDGLNNDDFNVFIWGGGVASISKHAIKNILNGTHNKAIHSIREFMKEGGGYVGACFGQMMLSKNTITPFMKIGVGNIFGRVVQGVGCNYTTQGLKELFVYKNVFPGGVMAFAKIKNFNSPVVYGLQDYIPMWHYGGPMPKICGDDVDDIAVFHNLTDVNGDLGTSEILQKICNKKIEGRSNIISTKYGKGKAVTYSSHHEKIRAFNDFPEYSCPIRLVHNSIFYVTSKELITIDIDKKINFSDLELEIIAPSSANVSELIVFQCSISNSTSPYAYLWNMGDGIISNINDPSHEYIIPGEFLITLVVADNNSNFDVCFLEINISGESANENRPPEKPINSYSYTQVGKPGELIYFRVKSEDPDGDLFWFKIIQDDEEDKIVNEYYTKNQYVESNQFFEFFNFWEKSGIHTIKVKAVDIHGAESEWADPIEIIITKHPIFTRLIARLLS